MRAPLQVLPLILNNGYSTRLTLVRGRAKRSGGMGAAQRHPSGDWGKTPQIRVFPNFRASASQTNGVRTIEKANLTLKLYSVKD